MLLESWGKENSYSLLLFFGFWNKVVLSLILKPWKCCFNFWKWKIPPKILSNNVGWEITRVQYHIVLITTKVAIHATRYTKLNCDEVTTMDIQSWLTSMFTLWKTSSTFEFCWIFERLVGDGTTLVANSPKWS
jgi:hypothetical protein